MNGILEQIGTITQNTKMICPNDLTQMNNYRKTYDGGNAVYLMEWKHCHRAAYLMMKYMRLGK